MQRPLILCLVAAVALSACGFGGSRLNPLNWFGKSREVAVAETAGPVNPLIPKGRSILARPLGITQNIYKVADVTDCGDGVEACHGAS